MHGTHLIVEAFSDDRKILNNDKKIKAILSKAAKIANYNVITIASHKFERNGVTAFALLSESHISIHTWPELGYAAIDIFTCGDKNPKAAFNEIKSALKLKKIRMKKIKRGF